MFVHTTIFFIELQEPDLREVLPDMFDLEPDAVKSREPSRELLSLYHGRNRMLPIDRES